MSVEKLTHEFASATVAAAAAGSPLYQAQLCKTRKDTLTKERAVQIGPCTSRLAPSAGGAVMEEFDAALVLIFLVRVTDGKTNTAKYEEAREAACDMAKAFALAVWNDPTMGGRVRDALWGEMPRDFDNLNSADYAFANLQLFINQTGHMAGED